MNFFMKFFFYIFIGVMLAGGVVVKSLAVDPDQKYAVSYSPILKGSDDPNFEEAVDALGGLAVFQFPGASYEGMTLVKDRILDGFEAALPLHKLSDGTSIFWGFKYKEAMFKSIAITDPRGRLCLMGAVTNVTSLMGGSGQLITAKQDYKEKLKRGMAGAPSVILFTRDERDLKAYLPLVKRWLQIELLGANTDCNNEKFKEACLFSQEVEIPITAYELAGADAKKSPQLRAIVVPNVQATSIPLN